jgi:uncharacterized protein YlxW (UPF0749 family)
MTVAISLQLQILALWGCIDMTNASCIYLSIVYKIQKKTTAKQDETLRRVDDLEESHDIVLKSIQKLQQHQERLLNKILSLEDKIDAVVEANKHD